MGRRSWRPRRSERPLERAGAIVEPRELARLLERSRVVALLGADPGAGASRRGIFGFLRQVGFDVVPVVSGAADCDGIKAYGRLRDVPGPIDLAVWLPDGGELAAHAEDALSRGVAALWLQPGLVRDEAAVQRALTAGLRVVRDRCVHCAYRTLLLGTGAASRGGALHG